MKDNLLEQTEKIEHAINELTINKINGFIDFIKDNPEINKIYMKEYNKIE